MTKKYRAYLGGQWLATADVRALRDPFAAEVFAEVALCAPSDIALALAEARAAAKLTHAMPSYARATVCRQVAAGLAQRREELADGIVCEAGKPLADARAEVDRAAHTFEIAAAEAERGYGEIIPLDLRPGSEGRLALSRRVPLALAVGVSPFNFPLNLAVHKVAPAFAAGCPIVLKPATQTPTSCLRLAEIVAATDWPKAAFAVVPATRASADRLVTDALPELLSFTGSAEVGWDLKARAGKKRVVLELGGNAAAIVDDSADVELAVRRLVYAAFSYAGQKCISVQRIYVTPKAWPQFCARFLDATAKVVAGDPRDAATVVGPMIDSANADRICDWVDEAVAAGARPLLRGARRGNLVLPTVLTGVPTHVRLACDEAFGPTVNLEPVADFDAAIAAVNDSRFGLQCGVFSNDLAHTLQAFAEIVVGAVVSNDAPSYRIDHMPYGGVKDSGLGREGVRRALHDFSEERLLILGAR